MSLRTRLVNFLVGGMNKTQAEQAIRYIARDKSISLLYHAYRSIGIHNCDDELSGEQFFVANFLKDHFKNAGNLILFDVGANIGGYTKKLADNFPHATIHSFEPINTTFKKLTQLHGDTPLIFLNNLALSDKPGTTVMYHYNDEESNNEHGTVHKEVLTDLFSRTKVETEEITLQTIDSYCAEQKIERIHFLKIDTEGHEFAVLQGAQKMINDGLIDIIQFEFNEMNIVSRVFLKDFYMLLKNYSFFRLHTSELIPLNGYNSIDEIFQFQNIIAIRK